MKRFSYSSLGSFKKCPQQFKIYYLDKVVKPDQGIEAFMGIIVHETLEYLYQEVVKGISLFWISYWKNMKNYGKKPGTSVLLFTDIRNLIQVITML